MRKFKNPPLLTIAIVLAIGLLAVLNQAQALATSEGETDILRTSVEDIAHIVVQFEANHQIVRAVEVPEPLTGLEALQNTGLEVVSHDFGGGFIAVCAIGGVGCSADDCFCSSNYWSYSFWNGSDWEGYGSGAGDTTVEAGDVEAWRWVEFGNEPLLPPAPAFTAAELALSWLAEQQGEDGSYGNISSDIDALLAVGANGWTVSGWKLTPDSAPLLNPIMRAAPGFTLQSAGQAGKVAAALVGAEGCWPHGAVLPAEYYEPGTGQYFGGAFRQGWAILGVLALGEKVPDNAVTYLKELVQEDGGWEFDEGFGSDTNTTALVIQALIAAREDVDSSLITQAFEFLKSAQNDDGGFAYDPVSTWGRESDTNSTAYVIQAILAAGQDPESKEWTMEDGNPLIFLLGMQLPDGSFEWQPGFGSDGFATQQAIPALLGRTYPLQVGELDVCPVVFMPVISRHLNP
jgi:hypothetical protein